jgi:glycosyltransferase involved in cell wall biosynthesis
MANRNIIFAPLINSGGGKKLLTDIIQSLKDKNTLLFLDRRYCNSNAIKDIDELNIISVNNNILDLLIAEFRLYMNSNKSTKVLCFHGAPPVFRNSGYVIVFFQNKLHLDKINFFNFNLLIKKYFFVGSFDFCQKIIVQTESMKFELIKNSKPNIDTKKIDIFPFANSIGKYKSFVYKKHFDFIYVADGYNHKNHLNLFLAWAILAKKGIFPSLVLTVPKSDKSICRLIDTFVLKYKLNIKNMYTLDHEDLIKTYLKSRALIYPSLSESFGLPLVEASYLNIPIIASELDFVRDVSNPNETFNPNSPLSISRAVERFLKISKKIKPIFTASQFLDKVFNESS